MEKIQIRNALSCFFHFFPYLPIVPMHTKYHITLVVNKHRHYLTFDS